MVQRLPTRDDSISPLPSSRALPTARTDTTAEVRAAGQQAAALGRIGEGLGALGIVLEERRRNQENFTDQLNFTKWDSGELDNLQAAKEGMAPGAVAFAETGMAAFDQSAAQFLETVSPHNRQKYEILIADRRGTMSRAYGIAEINEGVRHTNEEMDRVTSDVRQRINNDPAGYDHFVQQGLELIESTGLTPLQIEAKKKEFLELASISKLDGDFRNDPEMAVRNARMPKGGNAVPVYNFVQKSGFPQVFAAALVGRLMVESYDRMDPNAINYGDGADGSDSIGIMQWNAGRAKDLKRYAKNDAKGRPWNDITLQAEFMVWEMFTRYPKIAQRAQNASTPEEALRVVFDHIRPGGWKEGGDLSQIKGYDKTVSNMRKILAGELGDAAYENIPFETRQKLADGYEAEYSKMQKAEYGAMKDELTLDMTVGVFDSMDSLFQDSRFGRLDDGDKAAFIDDLQAELEKGAGERAVLDFVNSGQSGTMNYRDTEMRNNVDGAYETMATTTPPEQMAQVAEKFAAQTQIIPKKALDDVVITSQSDDPRMMASAFEQGMRFRDLAPGHYRSFSNGDGFRKDVDRYESMTDIGVPDEDAARYIAAMRKPGEEKIYKQLVSDPKVDAHIKDINVGHIEKQFDRFGKLGGWGYGTPQLGETLDAQNYMVAQWKELLKANLWDFSKTDMPRDEIMEKAEAKTLQDFSRQNTVSQFTYNNANGPNHVITQFPIETTQPKNPYNGTHDWVRMEAYRDLEAELKQLDPKMAADLMPESPSDIYLNATHETVQAARAGEPTGYVLSWKPKGGGPLQTFNSPYVPELPSRDVLLADSKSQWSKNVVEEAQRQIDQRRLKTEPLEVREKFRMRMEEIEAERAAAEEAFRNSPAEIERQELWKERSRDFELVTPEEEAMADEAAAEKETRAAQQRSIQDEAMAAGDAAYEEAVRKGGSQRDAIKAREKAERDFLGKTLGR
jgi:hypothetical protein